MNHRVVITGMGIVSPIGSTLEQFRTSLLEGKCGIHTITRFDTADCKVKVAAEVTDFDPLLYMSKIDVKKNDLYTRFAIGAAAQAVEQSGIIGNIDPDELGVYFGSGIGGFSTFVEEHDTYLNRGASRVSPHFVPKMISNIAAGTIAIRYGAKGPCISIATACATGTNAIGEAYRAVKHGYCTAAVTGGAEASIHPLAVAGFSNMTALTTEENPDRASIPFDKNRSGFVMGEGAGALVIETLEHAQARGAVILAEIVGYGSTCDAHHITAPDPEASSSARAVSLAMKEAGYTSDDVVYINAHGTSTPMNDKTETAAFKLAFGEDAAKLHISSTKSMTGHMLGAAGAAEAIASVIALQTGIIPPTIHYETPDPECELDITPNTPVQADPTLALSTSLGFGGHNGCLALRKWEH